MVRQFEETSYYLKDVAFVTADIGWAVGEPHWDQTEKRYKGTIIKTTNAGDTWSAQEAGVTEGFRGVCFLDANQGWVVGANGTILHTSDGGNLWVKQTVATTDDFRGVVFVDNNTGWATCIKPMHYDSRGEADNWQAAIWHTSDGGENWVQQAVPTNTSILNRIDFIDSLTGWAVGNKFVGYDGPWPEHEGAIYHTTDGGLTWSEQYNQEQITFTAVDALVFKMIRNLCLNHIKHLKVVENKNADIADTRRWEELYRIEFVRDEPFLLIEKELEERINLTLDTLPDKCQEVFVLSRINGLKNKEIANFLNISLKAVEKHMSRALSAFKKEFPLFASIQLVALILGNLN